MALTPAALGLAFLGGGGLVVVLGVALLSLPVAFILAGLELAVFGAVLLRGSRQ